MSSNGLPYFTIDPHLGWVFTFGQEIDRDTTSVGPGLLEVKFDIEATDSALNPLSSVAEVRSKFISLYK